MKIIHSAASVQMTTYTYIDGNYFMQGAAKLLKEWFPGAPLEFNFQHVGQGSQKVFFYDSLPAIKDKDEAQEAFEIRRDEKAKFFETLRAHQGWHVQE